MQIGSDDWIAERLGSTRMEDRDIEIEKRKTVDDIRPEETAHEAAMAKEPRQGDEVGHAGCARNAYEAASRTTSLGNAIMLNTIERTRPRSTHLHLQTRTHRTPILSPPRATKVPARSPVTPQLTVTILLFFL